MDRRGAEFGKFYVFLFKGSVESHEINQYSIICFIVGFAK